jgi:hypothetical protein
MTEKHKDNLTEPAAQKPGHTDAAGLARWVMNTTPQEAEAEFEWVTGRNVTELPHLLFLEDESLVAATPASPFAQRTTDEHDAPARPRQRKRWSLAAAAATAASAMEGLKRIEGADVAIGSQTCSFYSDGTTALIAGLPESMSGRFLVCNGCRLALEWLSEREMYRVVGLTFNALDQAIEALEAGDLSVLIID